MMTTQKSSWLTKEAGEAQREWYVIDATGHTLGRLASRIALVLRGKHKATYTPNVDMGDFVIVLNAGGVKLTVAPGTASAHFYSQDTRAVTSVISASGGGGVTGTQNETIAPGAPTSLSVTPISAIVGPGKKQILTASGTDTFAVLSDATDAVVSVMPSGKRASSELPQPAF